MRVVTGHVGHMIDDKAGRSTDTELAKRFGVAQVTFSSWRTGRCLPGSDNYRQVADWLGVSPAELVRLIGSDKAAKVILETGSESVIERIERIENSLMAVRNEMAKIRSEVARRAKR